MFSDDLYRLSSHQINKLKIREKKTSRTDTVQKEGDFVGVVSVVHGRLVSVEDDDGKQVECFLRGRFRKRLVVGDMVTWSSVDKKNGVVCSLIERRNLLQRNSPMGKPKAFAANVDVMVVVSSVKPELKEGLLDRYLVEAESQGMEVILVLNKIDLLNAEVAKQRIAIYEDVGYPVCMLSTVTDEGVDALSERLVGKVSIFVGNSGVGKTSILNAITGGSLKVSAINENSGQGKHTTSAAKMFSTPNGATIIDSPGVRTFGLSYSFVGDNVGYCFKEFRRFSTACRFENCSHIKEDACGVKDALERGEIHSGRYKSYCNIMRSLNE